MKYFVFFVTGGLSFWLLSWIFELMAGGGERELRLSSDETVAFERVEKLADLLADDELPELSRRTIWRHSIWIWKTTRILGLRSGRWSSIPWLVLFWLLHGWICLKTILFPNSHDLRILLGAKDFIAYFVLQSGQR